DILLTTIPLTLHDGPLSVCFLGWGDGVPVSTALEFPVARIVCADSEPRLPELTYPKSYDSFERGLNPQHDDRMTWLPVAPALALRGRMDGFDVIVSNPTITSLTHSSSEFTAEFYLNAARKLNAGGIFCQRIQHSDQGIDVFLDSIATMGSVFPYMTT